MQRNPSEKLWAGLKLTELKQALQEIYGLDFRTVAESQKLNFRTTTTGRILDTQSEFDVLSDFRRPDDLQYGAIALIALLDADASCLSR